MRAAALWQGGTLVTMPRFDLEQFLTILQDYRVSRAAVVPPIVLALAKHPLVDRFDLSALRFVLSGAAPLGAELEEACGRRLGCVVGQGYGLTETGPVLTAHPPEEARIRHGSAGQLLPNTEARVVDLELPAAVLDQLRVESARLADAQIPAGLSSTTAAGVAASIKWAFVDAFRWTVGIAGALCWLGAVLAAWLLPGRSRGIRETAQRMEVQSHAVD